MGMNPLKDESIDKRSPIPMYYQIMRIFAHLVSTVPYLPLLWATIDRPLSHKLTSWSSKYDRHGPEPTINGCIKARSACTVCIRS